MSVIVAGLVAAGALLAALGAGSALLQRAAPAVLHRPAGWAYALGVGIAGHAALSTLVAGLGGMGVAAAVGILAALAAGWLQRPVFAAPKPPSGWAFGAVGLLLLPAVVAALAPPTDTDELYQHLALARRIAEDGGLLGGFDTPDGSRPQLVHTVFASLYALGGVEAARLWHLGLAGALLLAGGELGEARFGEGRGLLPALVVAGSYSFVHEAGLAYNDVPAAYWLLLGAALALDGAGMAAGVGLFLGLALAAKYTAAPAAAAAGLVLLARSPGARLRTFGLAAAGGLAALAPWWLRNVASGLHPLFPYAGWPAIEGFRFMYAEKYGVGHTWADAALLPINVLFRARIETYAFFGQLSWGWLGLGLGAAWAARRDRDARALLFVVLVGFVAWGATAQILRFLLPMAGLALFLGSGARLRTLTVAGFLLSLPQNHGPLLSEARAAWPVVTGREDREVYRRREVPGWGAVAWLRDHVPPDEPVALCFAWQGFYVRQPWLLGSVEEHTPTRHWLATHGEASLRTLRDRGVRWLLVGDVKFLRKSYPFLSDADYRHQFVEPTELMRKLLAAEAVRRYGAARWEVWQLDAPRNGD